MTRTFVKARKSYACNELHSYVNPCYKTKVVIPHPNHSLWFNLKVVFMLYTRHVLVWLAGENTALLCSGYALFDAARQSAATAVHNTTMYCTQTKDLMIHYFNYSLSTSLPYVVVFLLSECQLESVSLKQNLLTRTCC